MRRRWCSLSLGLMALIALELPALAGRDIGSSFSDTGARLLYGRWAAISPFYGSGASQLGVTAEGLEPTTVGVRYTERKGHVTGFIFALLNSVATGMAASSPKSVRSWRSGNYLITETTYRSAAERRAILDQGAQLSDEMMSAEDQSFDLEIYSTSLPGGGEASGYKMNMYFGVELTEGLVVDLGLGWGSVTSRMVRGDRQARIDHDYFGMPLRVNLAAGPLLLWFQWDWNWLGEWSGDGPNRRDEPTAFSEQLTGSDLQLGLSTALLERLLIQASVTTPKIDSLDLGYRVSLGLRF